MPGSDGNLPRPRLPIEVALGRSCCDAGATTWPDPCPWHPRDPVVPEPHTADELQKLEALVTEMQGLKADTDDVLRGSQVGGSHYQDMAISPLEYIEANGLGFAEGCVIKYVSRFSKKNGLEDLEKAEHYIKVLKQRYKKEESDGSNA